MNFKIVCPALLAGVAVLVGAGVLSSRQPAEAPVALRYSEFVGAVRSGEVSEVTLDDRLVEGTRVDGTRFTSVAPEDPGLIGELLDAGVTVDAAPPAGRVWGKRLLLAGVPILLVALVAGWLAYRQHVTGRGGALTFGRSQARRFRGAGVTTRLAEVAGVDEAKEEVSELVDFLADPERFHRLGGTIPRGVLMIGPPGTGKTLLARAIAGEAGVPFFTASGSDFVEMFVGVGASRVRSLFKQAKKHAPCIVFVDEIDAVGRRRGASAGGANDEREQTLNQLLVEMDGFEGNEGIIVIAATNRADVLDPALLRPGRFDRQVTVPLPDVRGRARILKVHMRRVPLAADVDAAVLARGTPGFSGADLANLVNEAALVTARDNAERVGMAAFERARDKILMGAERRSMVMSEDAKERTAYHEAGHAIVGRFLPEHDPVHKVSIVPRGRALGVTVFLPDDDRYSASKRRLESQIASLFGGRVAEEMIYGEDGVSTGASNDIERATRIARDMVTRYGFSPLGPLTLADEEGDAFGGGQPPAQRSIADHTAQRIDAEVRAIIERGNERARGILQAHRELLERMTRALVERETIDSQDLEALFAGAPLPPAPVVDVDDEDRRTPGARPGAGSRAAGPVGAPEPA